MKFVTMVENNDGGYPAVIHESREAAKAWVRAYLMDPDDDPPQSEEERQLMEQDLASVTGEYVQRVRGSEAWKEWVYISLVIEEK